MDKKREIDLSKFPRLQNGNINWDLCEGTTIKFIYNNIEGIVEITKYSKENKELTIKYNNRYSTIKRDNLIKCQMGKILNIVTSDFKVEIGTIFKGEKRDITIINREYRIKYKKDSTFKQNQKWYQYHCNKDGYEGWIIESSLLNKHGCQCCSGHVVVEGINDIPTTAPWMIPYFQGGIDEAKLYTCHGGGNPNNRRGYINPICPDCGKIKDKKVSINSIYKKQIINCINCGDGVKYPNKFMFNLLQQLNVNFETEYSPTWIKPKAYDFYIPSMNLIIEMDGAMGHGNKVHPKEHKTIEESKFIDDYKDKQAKLHGIKVIRIDCNYPDIFYRFEFIKSNTILKICELFNLNKVNWDKCNEFALSNRMKEACDLWNKGINSTKELSEVMNLAQNTISQYLNQGLIIGWCNNYNPTLERNKSLYDKIEATKREVISIETGVVFESLAECERRSIELFGEKITASSVSGVCRNVHAHTHGYHFKYTSDLTEGEIKQIQENAKLNQAI